ncbi:MAG: hypothetical protein CL535_13115 [Ahrensia sp.]|nr:hypothetical protein [Ahrensia sp.]
MWLHIIIRSAGTSAKRLHFAGIRILPGERSMARQAPDSRAAAACQERPSQGLCRALAMI